MARILLSAMYCEPNRGSEEGVGWHFAVELARLGHDVTVLVNAPFRSSIEAYFDQHGPDPRLRFHYISYPRWALWLDEKFGLPDQVTHVIWQAAAYRYVTQKLSPDDYDLVWHVTIGVVRQTSHLVHFGPPFVFGPIAGGETSPWELRSNFSLMDHGTELFRDALNSVIPVNPLLQRMFHKAACILPRSPETRALLPKAVQERAHCNIGIGIDDVDQDARVEKRFEPGQPLKALYVGRFLYWKQPLMAIEAFDRFLKDGGSGELVLFGWGRMEERCRERIAELGRQDVMTIVKWLPQHEFFDVLRSADVVVFPSLHDGGGMVALEAMAFGVPVIAFDLGGPGQLVTEDSGMVIRSEGLSSAQAADEIAAHLKTLQDDPDLRARLRGGALERAKEFKWSAVVARAVEQVDGELVRQGYGSRLTQGVIHSGHEAGDPAKAVEGTR